MRLNPDGFFKFWNISSKCLSLVLEIIKPWNIFTGPSSPNQTLVHPIPNSMFLYKSIGRSVSLLKVHIPLACLTSNSNKYDTEKHHRGSHKQKKRKKKRWCPWHAKGPKERGSILSWNGNHNCTILYSYTTKLRYNIKLKNESQQHMQF